MATCDYCGGPVDGYHREVVWWENGLEWHRLFCRACATGPSGAVRCCTCGAPAEFVVNRLSGPAGPYCRTHLPSLRS